MPSEGLKVGEASPPRFEFRSFGQDFARAHHRMARLSMPVPEDMWERSSEETYIVSRTNSVNNTKVRNGLMDIKALVQRRDGLEQWKPLLKGTFPLPEAVLREELFPAFQVAAPPLPPGECSFEDFLGHVAGHRDLQAVRVRKQRFGYLVHGTICEYAVVLINGARVVSVGIESTGIGDIRRAMADIGLTGLENINYLEAIKRVIGMVRKHLANE